MWPTQGEWVRCRELISRDIQFLYAIHFVSYCFVMKMILHNFLTKSCLDMRFLVYGSSVYSLYNLIMWFMWCNLGKISLKTNMWHIQFSIGLKCSFCIGTFCWKPHLTSGSKVYEQLKDSQTLENKKKFIPFSGYISWSMLPTSNWFCY